MDALQLLLFGARSEQGFSAQTVFMQRADGQRSRNETILRENGQDQRD